MSTILVVATLPVVIACLACLALCRAAAAGDKMGEPRSAPVEPRRAPAPQPRPAIHERSPLHSQPAFQTFSALDTIPGFRLPER